MNIVGYFIWLTTAYSSIAYGYAINTCQCSLISSLNYDTLQPWRISRIKSDILSMATPSTSFPMVDYPIKIRNVISRMTSVTQKALNDKLSRMEIELPPGVSFGVETKSSTAKLLEKESKSDLIRNSNREAARLITEMFNIISSTTAVLFPSEDEAFKARNLWGKSFTGSTLSIDIPESKGYGKLRSRRFTPQEQQQALLGVDGVYIPEDTNLLVIAGPRMKDLKKIQKIHEKLGDATLIILLNARIGSYSTIGISNKRKDVTEDAEMLDLEEWYHKNFVNVFNYAPPITGNTMISEKELLLYHEYNSRWFLAQQESVKNPLGVNFGQSSKFTTLWSGNLRPSDHILMESISFIKPLS